jgi:hypothetical protein
MISVLLLLWLLLQHVADCSLVRCDPHQSELLIPRWSPSPSTSFSTMLLARRAPQTHCSFLPSPCAAAVAASCRREPCSTPRWHLHHGTAQEQAAQRRLWSGRRVGREAVAVRQRRR